MAPAQVALHALRGGPGNAPEICERTGHIRSATDTALAELATAELASSVDGGWGTSTAPRHVGMYLGDRLIVQAPRSGDVVKVSSLDSWLPEVVAIRRMVA
ncbi:hypothetical protein DLE60_27315 [Micromonospora globispora]|uniref:NlpC/P60 domain-containing protein n=1 Tax=Micromonospora globispora TaxID=1450148 RepID=A0A317KEN5_9ACTN|nr:hypothetical protein [Micromonospora globispora]PWU51483.1 hypothetical protein DLJ46_05015 [Micromonospora globispora]PWU55808.1 hypothetical protein DLE60_27315 [Micromonospora globispora]RQX00647.1 hypothetical protein DKL51_06545 [Micromonospora globispora]